MEDDTQHCSNCKRDIPGSNFVLHSVHCQKNIVLCKRCREPVLRSESDRHEEEAHSKVKCSLCGTEVDRDQLEGHQSALCPSRMIGCRYCDLELQSLEITEHENYCGSRTERCGECGEFVMLKYRELHEDSNHGFLKLDDEPGPAWQADRQPLLNNPVGMVTNHTRKPLRAQKLFNASRDAARPTAGVNRLSPSKRNNDLPQVNSAPSVTKALHKSPIQGLETDGVAANVDQFELDRLLALHLAEEDASLLNPFETGAILNGATELPLHPTAPPPPTPTDEQRGGFGSNSKIPSGFDAEENVCLPCEFCETMVPIDELILHQSGCQQGGGMGMFGQGNRILNDLSRETQLSSSPVTSGNYLPCEFCGELLRAEFLVGHEVVCEMNERRYVGVLSPPPRPPPPRPKVRNSAPSPPVARRGLRRQGDPTTEPCDSEAVNLDVGFEKRLDKPSLGALGGKMQNASKPGRSENGEGGVPSSAAGPLPRLRHARPNSNRTFGNGGVRDENPVLAVRPTFVSRSGMPSGSTAIPPVSRESRSVQLLGTRSSLGLTPGIAGIRRQPGNPSVTSSPSVDNSPRNKPKSSKKYRAPNPPI